MRLHFCQVVLARLPVATKKRLRRKALDQGQALVTFNTAVSQGQNFALFRVFVSEGRRFFVTKIDEKNCFIIIFYDIVTKE